MSQPKNFWARIDTPHFPQALEWLNKHPNVLYFFAHEQAERAHEQGWLICTLSQKGELWRHIKTDRNSKASGDCDKHPLGIAGMQDYCCKGYGLGQLPTFVTNHPKFTQTHVENRHAAYWAKHQPNNTHTTVTIERPVRPRETKKTVFAKLLEWFTNNYDKIGDGYNHPEFATVKAKVSEYYNDDVRLAGTGVRKRAMQEILLRFSPEFVNRCNQEVFSYDQLCKF